MVLAQIVREWERDALMEMEIVYIKLQPWNTPKAAIDFKSCVI